MIELEVAQEKAVRVSPERFVVYALQWALWKAEHQQWQHVDDILNSLWAPVQALLDAQKP